MPRTRYHPLPSASPVVGVAGAEGAKFDADAFGPSDLADFSPSSRFGGVTFSRAMSASDESTGFVDGCGCCGTTRRGRAICGVGVGIVWIGGGCSGAGTLVISPDRSGRKFDAFPPMPSNP